MSATLPDLAAPRPAWWKALYAQVLIAIAVGGALGHFAPDFAVALKPLGDAFIKLVKLIIAPVIFHLTMLRHDWHMLPLCCRLSRHSGGAWHLGLESATS